MSRHDSALTLRGPKVAFLAIVFCTIWSSAFVATKFGLEAAPPLVLATMRFFLASVVLLIVARLMGHNLMLPQRDLFIIGGMGVLNNAVYLGLTFVALQSVSAGLVSVLASTNPLLTTCAAALWLGDRPRPVHFLGLGLGIAGSVIVLHHRLTSGDESAGGVGLALVGVVALVGGTVLFKKVRVEHSLLVMNGYQLAAGGLALLPLAIVQSVAHPTRFGGELFGSLAYLSFAVSIGGTLIWLYLLRRGSARAVSAYHFLNPVIGLSLSSAVLREPLAAIDLVGLLPIMLGIVLVSRPSKVLVPKSLSEGSAPSWASAAIEGES